MLGMEPDKSDAKDMQMGKHIKAGGRRSDSNRRGEKILAGLQGQCNQPDYATPAH